MSQAVVQQFKHYPYLISKWADPLLAISMGVAAYYAYEKRVGREPGHTLNELLMRKWENWNKEK